MAKFNSETARLAKASASPRGPNKTTKLTRELIVSLLEGEYEHMQKAIERMRKKSPIAYLNACMQLMEYSLPKLSRTELTGKDGDSLLPVKFVTVDEKTKLAAQNLKKSDELN